MLDIKQSIKNLVKWCCITKSSADNKQFPVAQITSLEKVADCVILYPYGLYANAPTGALGVMFCMEGDEQNKAAIVNVTDARVKNLKEGEVVTGNPITGSCIKFDKDKNMVLTVNNDLQISVNNDNQVTINGSYNLTVAGQANLQASQFNFNGNIVVNGTITANDGGGSVTMSGGALTTTGDVIAQGVSLKTHIHSGVTMGGDDTGAPV